MRAKVALRVSVGRAGVVGERAQDEKCGLCSRFLT